MIPRYEKKEISNIWTDEYKFQTYLKVEAAILKAIEGDKVPVGTADKILKNAKINVARVNEIEQTVHHDVIAFCTSITENIEPAISKYFHFGVTSSDIIDSALTLQMKDSLEIILPAFKVLVESLKNKAIETKDVICMGRSHGMYAEPMSFGQKWLGFYAELLRRYDDLSDFFNEELTVQLSGAVGNYTILTPEHEEKAAKNLGLKVEPVSTQVIPRDRIAKLVNINALIASAIERIAVEIRHLHRSDVGELFEGFAKGQKGSSTMPHKKNPISGENLTGISRVLRSHTNIALDNIVLWHERDISHSSAERMYLPDNLGLLLYAITRLTSTINNLVINKDVVEGRVRNNYTYLSSFYLHELIQKTDFSREENYSIVQKAAFTAQESNSPEVFHSSLVEILSEKSVHIEIPKPTFEEIKSIFLKNIDTVFDRAIRK